MATKRTTKPAEDTTPRIGEELSDYRRRCPRVRWVSLAHASILAERDPSTIRQKKGVKFYDRETGLVDIADEDFEYLCYCPSRKPIESLERLQRLGIQ